MKLVSIVSPCYNGESYVERYIKSILSQTYRPLELIFVNDGSTDATEDILLSYKETFEKEDITLKYIKKDNGGLGAAINDGLKYITGDYIIWPDTDDFLMPGSIEKRVRFLEEHTEFGFVYSDGAYYDETDTSKPLRPIIPKIPADGYLFENVVSGNVVYTPCGYMLRTSAFLDVNPQKEIFPSRYGQDIQMLMPISYKYRCGHLKECLYGHVVRENSLSKQVWREGDNAWKNRALGLEEIYVQTLKAIGGEALAYIPYIHYRTLRTLNATSKKISPDAAESQKATLKCATALLLKEILKTLLNSLRGK